MPYQPRSYPLVPIPEVRIDPMASLADIIRLSGGLEELKLRKYEVEDVEKQRASRKAIEEAITASKGNVPQAITALEGQGRWQEASGLRQRQGEIEKAQRDVLTQQVDAIGTRMKSLKTTAARGSELLGQVKADPTLYPRLRPMLQDLAGGLHPELAAEIPEQYDESRVTGMVQFAADLETMADARAKAIDAAKEKLTAKETAKKTLDLDTSIVRLWFGVSPNQEDWDRSMEYARGVGISNDVLAKIGPTWSPEAVARAKQLGVTPAAATGQPRSAVVNGRRVFVRFNPATGRDEEVSGATPEPSLEPLVPVIDKDGKRVWVRRSQAAGMAAPEPREPVVNIGSAERDRARRLTALRQEQRDLTAQGTPMSQEDYDAEVADIEASYQRQLSTTPRATGGGPAGAPAPKPPKPSAVPAAVAAIMAKEPPNVEVELSDGSVWLKSADGMIRRVR